MDTNVIQPKVSVIICTYNRADLLVYALTSVREQTYRNLEIIVLDDASTDNTNRLVSDIMYADARVKYIKNEVNLGITRNRNKALALATGSYIAVLDSDDYWIDRTKIQKQIDFLSHNSRIGVVGTQAMRIDEKGNSIGKIKVEIDSVKIHQSMLIKNPFIHSSVLFRKEALKEYSGKFFIWEDYATWLEIGNSWLFSNLPDYCTAYREHPNNISKKNKIRKILELQKIIYAYKNAYPKFLRGTIKNILRIIF